MDTQIETPYITRTRQPEPKTDSGKAELFKPGSEQAERSMLSGMIKDMESSSPKDNLRALGALQNMNILSIRSGESPDLDKVKAPIPGMDAERTIKGMIEDGQVKPSDSMRDVADRHGLEIPERNPEGPSPFRKENAPDMLSMPEPEGPLQNAGLREITGKLADQCQEPTKEKAEAFQALDTAFKSISSPMEQMLLNQNSSKDKEQENGLPWEKSPSKTHKVEDLWINPIGVFNDAAKNLEKLGDKAKKEVMDAVFTNPLENIQKNLQKSKEGLTDFLKDPIGCVKKCLETFERNSAGKEKDNTANTEMEKRGITPERLVKDPIGTCIDAIGLMKEKSPLFAFNPALLILEAALKGMKKGADAIDKTGEELQNFLADQPIFQGHIKKKGQQKDKAPAQTPDVDQEPSPEASQAPSPEASQAPQKETAKNADTVPTKSTPGAEGVKAAIEVVSAACSDKKPMDKLADIGGAVGKGIVNVAQGVGTKVLAGAMATPVAPIAAAVALLAFTAKFTAGKLLDNIFPRDNAPEPSKGISTEKNAEPSKDESPKGDDKGDDFLEKAINFLLPKAGGKKGMMVQCGFKALEKVGEWGKGEITGENGQKAGEKQMKDSPNLSMQ